MFSCRSQAPDHDANHAKANHRLTVVQTYFIIAAQPARLEQPPERAFDYPSSPQHFETFDIVATADNFQSQFAEGLTQMVVAYPLALGDNHEELIESLSRVADAGLSLHIVGPRIGRAEINSGSSF